MKVVSSVWWHAVITPVPKVQSATSVANFRPVSVTPVSSRFTERLVMRDYFLPAIQMNVFLINLHIKLLEALRLL